MLLATLLACAAPDEAPVDPGHVVLRRLTRDELDHTVRDLFGTTLRPARALPPDDFALGFDGIGLVQTFSALHLELWESGVDDLLDELFGAGELPAATVVVEAEGPEARATVGAVAEATAWVLWDEGSLVATFVPTVAGEYRLSATVWADDVGVGPASGALLVDGEPVARAEITGPGELEASIPLAPGVHALGVAYLPIAADDRHLVVDRLSLVGPLGVDRPPSPNAALVLVCDPASEGEPACAETVVRTFARRAWRRPPSNAEVQRLLGLYGLARGAGGDWTEGVRAALRGVLLSPWFLYKVELHDDVPGDQALSGFELATRLSYFLWSSTPDDRLLDLAQAGTLGDADVLEAEARRMLADPRADGLVTSLGGQWLGLRKVDEAAPSPELFPAWDEGLRDGLRQELHDALASVLLGDRPLTDLLLAPDTRVDERVAAHYGLTGTFPAVVELPERPGILGRGGLLAALALPDRTSPVVRGNWVLGQLLCAPAPPPPAGIPPIDEDPETPTSLRDQLEQHRADPACAACHVRMDAIGLALESFDATGAWRTVDEHGLPVDTTGELDGEPFADARGMAALVAADPAFVDCAVQKTFTFALGRAPEAADAPALAALEADLVAGGLSFRELAVAVVRSRAFRYTRPRRG